MKSLEKKQTNKLSQQKEQILNQIKFIRSLLDYAEQQIDQGKLPNKLGVIQDSGRTLDRIVAEAHKTKTLSNRIPK